LLLRDGITAEFIPAIDSDVGIWKADWEYTQVYESKTHRIPAIYCKRFYRFFHLAGIITINYIYQLSVFEIGFNSWFVLFVLMFYCINAIDNRGKLFYTQERR
jgi:hypothetical protein